MYQKKCKYEIPDVHRTLIEHKSYCTYSTPLNYRIWCDDPENCKYFRNVEDKSENLK